MTPPYYVCGVEGWIEIPDHFCASMELSIGLWDDMLSEIVMHPVGDVKISITALAPTAWEEALVLYLVEH